MLICFGNLVRQYKILVRWHFLSESVFHRSLLVFLNCPILYFNVFLEISYSFCIKSFSAAKTKLSVFSFKCAVLNAKMCFGKLKWLTLTFLSCSFFILFKHNLIGSGFDHFFVYFYLNLWQKKTDRIIHYISYSTKKPEFLNLKFFIF